MSVNEEGEASGRYETSCVLHVLRAYIALEDIRKLASVASEQTTMLGSIFLDGVQGATGQVVEMATHLLGHRLEKTPGCAPRLDKTATSLQSAWRALTEKLEQVDEAPHDIAQAQKVSAAWGNFKNSLDILIDNIEL